MMKIDKVTDIETDEISYELPKGWVLAKIGEFIAQGGVFIDGDWVESKDQDPNGDVRLIQLADIGDGVYRNKSQRFLTFDKAIELGCTFLEIGDVLIARMPDPLGRACIFPGDPKQSVTVVDVCIVRSGSEMINHRWLMYFINSPEFRSKIADMQSGSTRKRISRGNLARLKLPLPPLSEQNRIVAKIEELFTKLDAGVESLKKVQAQLKQYRQAVLKSAVEGKLTAEWRAIHKDELEPASVLLERIKKEKNKDSKYTGSLIDDDKQDKMPDLPDLPDGWVWAKVEGITESMKNGIYKPKDSYNDDGIACLRMYNIENGIIVWKDIKRMILTSQEMQEYELKPEDILVNRVNSRELVGKSAVIPLGLEKCVYESKNIRLRLSNAYIKSKYINFWFQVFSRSYFNHNAQQTVGMASINQEQLGAMPVPLPSLSEQQKITEEIENRLSIADEVEFIINAELKRAERLRQSILKQAFSGKLVSQDPNDEPASILLDRIKQEKAKNDNQRKGQKNSDNTEQMKLL